MQLDVGGRAVVDDLELGNARDLRQQRPEADFTISLRTGWDPRGMDTGRIADERDAYAEAGISHVVAAPWRNDLDAWLGSMDDLASIVLGP